MWIFSSVEMEGGLYVSEGVLYDPCLPTHLGMYQVWLAKGLCKDKWIILWSRTFTPSSRQYDTNALEAVVLTNAKSIRAPFPLREVGSVQEPEGPQRAESNHLSRNKRSAWRGKSSISKLKSPHITIATEPRSWESLCTAATIDWTYVFLWFSHRAPEIPYKM